MIDIFYYQKVFENFCLSLPFLYHFLLHENQMVAIHHQMQFSSRFHSSQGSGTWSELVQPGETGEEELEVGAGSWSFHPFAKGERWLYE